MEREISTSYKMLNRIHELRLYDHPQGLRLLKAIQLQLAIHIDQTDVHWRDFKNISKLYYIHTRVPIVHPHLFTNMVKVAIV